jgi:two-component sensor histidine kinase
MRKEIFFVVMLLVSFLIEGYAQTIPLRHFTDEDGLVSNVIYCISQDRNGYLWFSSDKGICRFNGKEFKNFSTADGMPDNDVFNIREDYEGRLWLSSFNGLLCYYKNNKFFTAKNEPWLSLPFKSPIFKTINQEDSSIIFIFNDQSKFVNIRHNKLNIYSIPSAVRSIFPFSGLASIKKITADNYKLMYRGGTVNIDTCGKVLKVIYYKKEFDLSYSFKTYSKEEYLLSLDGIYSIDRKLLFPIKTKLNFNYSSTIKILGNSYFVGLLNGLLINDSIIINCDAQVTFIEQDIAGNIWFSTKGKGIYSLSQNFINEHRYQNAYEGRIVHAKVHQGNVLFANNYGTLYEINNHKLQTVYKNDNYITTDKNFLTSSNFLINDSLDYILLDGKKAFSILRANRKMSQKISFELPISGSIKEVLYDNGKLYIANIDSFKWFDYASLIKQKSIKEYNIKIHQTPGDNRIYARAINQQMHSMWFSQEKKLFELQEGQQTEKPAFKNLTLRQFGFYKNYLIGLNEDNTLIIAYDYENEAKIEKVLFNNCIWSRIYPIDDHRAIISTNNYYRLLTLYPAKKTGSPNYTVQTIESPFVPLLAEYVAADSINCYFFKNETVTQIKTSVLFRKTLPPAPVFSSFKALNKSYLIRPEIKVSYDQSKSINIVFDNISFTGKDITCQYSITDNGKDEWREITGNEINLNTPGYGTYLVKVRSKTLSSEYSKPAVIRLIVQKPFWATWWFISLCALALIALVWGIIVFITWRKLRKKQKEHEADMKYQQSEYKALNALMNPHFIFNSLNNIQGLINKDEKRIANEYLVIFSDLVRQNMHNISKGFISLQQELTLIENYLTLEKLRFKELVNYEINVDEEVDVDDIMIPPLMIQPLVENAVKHGLLPKQSASSKVSIQVYEKDNLLYIVIEDNGVGLTQSLQSENKLHESFGLSNLQKRTEHLKKIQEHEINIEVTELKNSDGTVKGTQAIVTIQLNEA